jgi:molybdate transport system substrate-binding protein
MSGKRAAVVMAAMLAGAANGAEEQTAARLGGALFIYCAAGVKAPIAEIAKAFEAETGVKVELTYANSGQLLGQIEMTRTGDVYIPGDVDFVAKVKAKGLTTDEPHAFCYFVPALYVRKGNPHNIRDVADLTKPGLKLALAEPSAAIGQLQNQLFKKHKLDEAAIQRNTVTSPATVTDVALAVRLGTADAGIIWDALAEFAPGEAEVVRIPIEKNVVSTVSACTLASARNPGAARAFVAYLASDKGRAVLQAKGFTVEKPAAR